MKQKILLFILALVSSAYAFSQNNDSLRIKYKSHHPQDVKFRFDDFKVDDSKTKRISFNVSGYVKIIGTADFGNIQNTNEFITSMIPIYPSPKETGYRTNLDARQSRLALEGFYRTSTGKKLRIYLESDFYSSEASQYFGGYGFHLRHAYAEFGDWLVGQTWSTSFNINATPNQVDLEGPNSILAPRNAQIRYTLTKEKFGFAAALENNLGDYTPYKGIDDKTDYQLVPDFISYIEAHGDWGNARLTGIARNIAYTDSTNTTVNSVFGWGANISGYFNLFNRQEINDAFMWGISYGKGISFYVDDIMGSGYDAMPDSTGTMLAMPSISGYIAYKHAWTKRIESNIIVGYVQLDTKKITDNHIFDNSIYGSINLMASPMDRFDFGVEILYGKNVNKIQDAGEAIRIQIMSAFNF